MAQAVTIDRDLITAACRRFGVTRLALFGSVLTDRFDARWSDIDIAVDFAPGASDLFAAYFDLKDELERLFDRPVDLVVRNAIANPFIAAEVARTEELLYAA